MGSPGFVAPEIVADGPHTPAMDVWSAGVILFILLVGRKPFNLKDSSSLRYAYQPLLSAPGLQTPQSAPPHPLPHLQACTLLILVP